MTELVQTCPLCGSPTGDTALFDQRSLHGVLVINRLCSNCGLVIQSPRMTDAELEEFYEQEYRLLYQGSAGPNPKDLAVQAGRAQALVNLTQEVIPAVNRHLDIGCSAGLLLQGFQRAYNCQSIGIEPGDAYREYAQAQGLSIYDSLSDLNRVQPGRFDLISLAHVLEHIPNPVEYLTQLRQDWLASDGWLLIETPNLYGHDCFEVAHLVSFSPHTLKQVLQQAGFQIQIQTTHGRPRSELIPLYITALAKGIMNTGGWEKPNIEPENGVRRKRQMAMLRRRVVTRLSPRKAWLPVDG